MVVFPVSTDARILGRRIKNTSTGRALWGASFSFLSIQVLRCLELDEAGSDLPD
jgi:hypothetical protein